ncbi:MAG: Maf family protein [Saprospiraceae bacterium]|nr:Maf family protein [Saprospiraceae bacterium]
MYLDHPPLFLASKSPRRQELLSAAGISFQLIDVDVEEVFPEDMVVEDVPEFLARKKATAAIPLVPHESIVLAADSVVILDNIVFGKPADQTEAMEMLSKLAGRHHLVITGVFLGNHVRGIGFSEFTSVWIEPMSPEEIAYYVQTFPPLDKAGSYGIQDWLGWSKVSRIEGSYANVMGLPIHKVYETLSEWNKENH